MKQTIFYWLLLLAIVLHSGADAQTIQGTLTAKTVANAGYYLEYLPPGYNDPANANKQYPIIIFLHGAGSKGRASTCPGGVCVDPVAELNQMLLEGLPKLFAQNHDMVFTPDHGSAQSFIVVMPQIGNGNTFTDWSAANTERFVKGILMNTFYRFNTKKVYLTGLSLGGIGTYDYTKGVRYFSDQIAAIAPVAGKPSNPSTNTCVVPNNVIRVWSFHGDQDNSQGTTYIGDKSYITNMRACVPAPNPGPRFTVFPGVGHSPVVWNTAYDYGNAALTIPVDNLSTTPTENLYLWFLKNPKGGNLLPVANAGSDITVQLPTSVASLTGSGTDTDGTIANYEWTKISGGSVTTTDLTSQILSLTGLQVGTYSFSLKVYDDLGFSSTTDTVNITVTPGNALPVTNAGSDVTIQLPANTAILSGSATDSDGTISSYLWTQTQGGTATLSGATTATLSLSALTAGSYTFNLAATDNQGGVGNDQVQVTVLAANVPPTVSAGTDVTLQLPTNSTTLTAIGSDPDGSIANYSWTKLSGGTATLSGETTAVLQLTNLAQGTYTFRITVTDNNGVSSSDDVDVIVQAATSGNWLEMSATSAAGKSIAMYYDAPHSLKLVRTGGNDYMHFYLKTISGSPVWANLKIELLVSSQTRSLAVGSYVTSVGSTWTAVQIPLNDFGHDASRWTSGGLQLVNFKVASGFGTAVFGVDEIQFTGGTTPFVWYGDAYDVSGSSSVAVESSTVFIITQRHTTDGANNTGARISTHEAATAITRDVSEGDVVYIYQQDGRLLRKAIFSNTVDKNNIIQFLDESGLYIIRVSKPDGEVKTIKVRVQ